MQKMTLVPYDALLSHASQNNPYFRQTLDSAEPSVRKIKTLQLEIANLMDDPNLSESDKAVFLSQLQGQYDGLLNRYRQTLPGYSPIPPISSPPPPQSKASQLTAGQHQQQGTHAPLGIKQENKNIALLAIPKPYKNRAGQVIDAISNHPQFSVNDKNEIVIGEQAIPGSNLVDLLIHSVTPKSSLANLEGLESFTKVLREANVPRSFLNKRVAVYETEPPRTPTRPTHSSSLKWESYLG
jgi:hypothetical protein